MNINCNPFARRCKPFSMTSCLTTQTHRSILFIHFDFGFLRKWTCYQLQCKFIIFDLFVKFCKLKCFLNDIRVVFHYVKRRAKLGMSEQSASSEARRYAEMVGGM